MQSNITLITHLPLLVSLSVKHQQYIIAKQINSHYQKQDIKYSTQQHFQSRPLPIYHKYTVIFIKVSIIMLFYMSVQASIILLYLYASCYLLRNVFTSIAFDFSKSPNVFATTNTLVTRYRLTYQINQCVIERSVQKTSHAIHKLSYCCASIDCQQDFI